MDAICPISRKLESWQGKLFYPISRKFAVVVLAYIAGIVCARSFFLSLAWAFLLNTILLLICLLRWKVRKPMLLYICAGFFVLGNYACGIQLALRDDPTQPQTFICGTVAKIESEYRVMLTDVELGNGEKTNRPVVVTLMLDEEAQIPDEPLCGQRVSGVGRLFAQSGVRNPGGVDQRLRALCDGYELSGYLLPGWSAEGEETFSWTELFRRLRQSLSDRLNTVFGDKAPLFSAIVLGEKGDVDKELSVAMRLTGTAHILSVSGMHLSMVSAALYAMLKKLPIGRKTAYAIRALGLVFFAGLTGFAVGTLRALTMSLLSMYARLRGRKYDPLTGLSIAAFLITFFSPLMVFDVGFQFSFFVVLGIHLLMHRIEQLKPVRLLMAHVPTLCKMIVISTTAQIAALPMQLSLYGYVPLLSLPMNLLSGVILPLLMFAGWLLIVIGMIAPPFAQWLGSGVSELIGIYENALLFAADIPGGVLRLPAFSGGMLALFGCAMALLGTPIRFCRSRYAVCTIVLLTICGLYLPVFYPAARYVQIDVGQGDASLIRRGRKAVVIDVGPASSYELLRYLRHEGLSVEAVILSHLDADHAGALSVLLESEVDIPRVITAERALEDVNSKAVIAGVDLLAEKGIEMEFVRAGDSLDINGMRFDVLSPADDETGSNERSLLLRVDVEETSLLLAGDLPADNEPESVPDCDVLKVAHHGSKNASTKTFLEQASPEFALISVGSNSYGHPHSRVLSDLKDVGANILRTDESGCIIIWLQDEPRVETFLD